MNNPTFTPDPASDDRPAQHRVFRLAGAVAHRARRAMRASLETHDLTPRQAMVLRALSSGDASRDELRERSGRCRPGGRDGGFRRGHGRCGHGAPRPAESSAPADTESAEHNHEHGHRGRHGHPFGQHGPFGAHPFGPGRGHREPLGRALGKLTARGLVDVTDGRYRLSPSGQALRDTVRAEREAFRATITAGVSDADLDVTVTTLKRLADNLREQDATAPHDGPAQ